MKSLVKLVFGVLILANINTQYSSCKLVLGDSSIVEVKKKSDTVKNSGIDSCIVEVKNSIDTAKINEIIDLLSKNQLIITAYDAEINSYIIGYTRDKSTNDIENNHEKQQIDSILALYNEYKVDIIKNKDNLIKKIMNTNKCDNILLRANDNLLYTLKDAISKNNPSEANAILDIFININKKRLEDLNNSLNKFDSASSQNRDKLSKLLHFKLLDKDSANCIKKTDEVIKINEGHCKKINELLKNEKNIENYKLLNKINNIFEITHKEFKCEKDIINKAEDYYKTINDKNNNTKPSVLRKCWNGITNFFGGLFGKK